MLKELKYLIRDMEALIDADEPNAMVMYGIILSLAAMGILNAQVLSIFRRKKEIGTLMALGMTRVRVVGLFTLEGGLNAFFAIIMMLVLFGPILWYFATFGIPLPIDHSELGILMATRLTPVYSFGLLFFTTTIVSIIVLVVSYIPSRKISTMRPTDALKGKIII